MVSSSKKKDIRSRVRNLNVEVTAAGCLIEKSGWVYPSRTGDFVYNLPKDKQALRLKQVKALGDFFSKKWYKLLDYDIGELKVKQWLNLSNDQLSLVESTNPSLKDWTYYFGVDLCGSDLKITDFNSDRATIVGFQEEFINIFSSYYPSSKFKGFYKMIIPQISLLSNKKNPKVFVLTYSREQYRVAITNFAKKFGFDFGSIEQFNPNNYDLVIRQVKSFEIINNASKYKKLIDALSKGLPMINPLGSYMPGHKGWITIICSLNLMPLEWFPRSWLINGDLRMVLSSDGKTYGLDEIKHIFMDDDKKNVRKNFVVKKGFGAGGGEVYIGADMKKHQWYSLWNEILLSRASWVIEEKLPRNNEMVWVGNPLESSNLISVKEENLNLIERIYSVYPFDDFCAEVFGKRANKVNASGYTFPVSLL